MINERIDAQSSDFAGYYQIARIELLDLLGTYQPKRVLEIGCGGGANLVALKQRWPSCSTTGLELRRDAANAARQSGYVDEVLEADVTAADEALFAAGQFDLIVMSHVLEHFASPELVLGRANRWLSDGGRVLIALPNIRHVSVLWDLVINGEFRYQPSGILDHTHLRFYTRKSATRFLTANGLRILRTEPEFGGGKSRMLKRLTWGAADDLAAYAYNFVAEKA